MVDLIKARDDATVDRLVGAFAIKLIGEGLSSDKLREYVRKLERKNTSLYQVKLLLANAQQDLSARQLPAHASAVSSGSHRNGGNGNNGRQRSAQSSGSGHRPAGRRGGREGRSAPHRTGRQTEGGHARPGESGQFERRPSGPNLCHFCGSSLHMVKDCPSAALKAAAAVQPVRPVASAAIAVKAEPVSEDLAFTASSASLDMFDMMDDGCDWLEAGN